MPNLAAAGAAHEPYFSHTERREIVVQHEALGGFAQVEHFDPLLVILGAKRGRDQSLRFTAREDGGAVRARQNPYFAGDGANLIERPAIRAATIFQHLVTEDPLLKIIESFPRFCLVGLFSEQGKSFLLRLIHPAIAIDLTVL